MELPHKMYSVGKRDNQPVKQRANVHDPVFQNSCHSSSSLAALAGFANLAAGLDGAW